MSSAADGSRERDLVARVQRGDSTAFDELVRRHIESAHMAAYRILRNDADVEDVVQDAFLRALDRIALFDNSRPFGPWLHRLVVNTAINFVRARTVRETEPEPLDAPAGGPNPHQAAEHSEFRERFNEALAGLSERQRTTVVLYDVEGYGTEEIAKEMGVSQETVRGHLFLARKALRVALAEFRETMR